MIKAIHEFAWFQSLKGKLSNWNPSPHVTLDAVNQLFQSLKGKLSNWN